MYPHFEGSLPWLESKSDVTRLEYTTYTYFEKVLRYVRSEPIWDVSILFIRSRIQVINCCSLGLKKISRFGSYDFFFMLLTNRCIEEGAHIQGRAQRRDRNNNPWLHATPLCFKMQFATRFREEMIATDLWRWAWEQLMFGIKYCLRPSGLQSERTR